MTTSTLKMQHIARQIDLIPESILSEQVNIIGAGAIGSWTTLALAKMGFNNIAVFDHDDVDIVNMSSQFYSHDQVGRKKVEALSDNIERMTGGEVKILPIPERWAAMKLRGVVVMAVDSMAVRKEIYEAHKGNTQTKWLIDSRMGAETALLYTLNPNSPEHCERYKGSLYSDADAVQERCTAKSTTYCSLVLSGLVAKTVRDVLMKGKYMHNMTFSLKGNDFLAFSEG